jgi:hypothetical protein
MITAIDPDLLEARRCPEVACVGDAITMSRPPLLPVGESSAEAHFDEGKAG